MTLEIKETQSCWEFLQKTDLPIFIYGMGDGALKILSVFEKYNIPTAGFFASDEFVRGHSFEGHLVHKLSQIEQLVDDFVIVLAFAAGYESLYKRVNSIAEKHLLLAPDVPVAGGGLFDYDYFCENKEKFEAVYDRLEDEASRKTYENVINFKISGKIEYLNACTSDKSEVYSSIVKLGKNERYVDLGAYNGDTIDEFLHYTNGSYKRIIAFEPNAKNFEKLKLHCKGMANVSLWQLGSYSKNTELIFNNKAGRNSAIADKGVATKVATVDTILCGMAAGYIKADVEGADMETLIGMQKTMENCKPKLNFSAYHRFEDIFRLALYIHSVNPDYKIFLRHHPYIPAWDTNLYCI